MRLRCAEVLILMDAACKIQPNEPPWSPLLKVAFRLKNYCWAPLNLRTLSKGASYCFDRFVFVFPQHNVITLKMIFHIQCYYVITFLQLFWTGCQGRRYRGVGVWGGGGVTPPIIQTLVKVGRNGTDIFPKLVKMEVILLKIEGKTRKSLIKVWDKDGRSCPKL